ncbi:MAG: hypothetical protein Q9191_003788 [Dirinaria sp. TL-2023a]
MAGEPESLWEKAFASLNDENKSLAGPRALDKRTFLIDFTKVVEEKRLNCAKREWKFIRNGKEISTRDIFGRMITWISKFKEVGDVASQYDSTHAALPWAAVRLVLQAIVNEYQTNESLLEGLEYITSLIARFAMVEGLYLKGLTVASKQLSDTIIRLYSAILTYLAKAHRFYSRNTAGRFVKAATQPVELSVGSYLQKVHDEETRVNDLARLLDADYSELIVTPLSSDLRQISSFMEERFVRYENKLDTLDQGIQGLQLTLNSRMSPIVSAEQVLDWIAAVFTKEDYEQALAVRTEGSCDWILKRPEFVSWRRSKARSKMSRILWVYGSAGFGKSILCARTIHYLQTELHKSVPYFFCSFSDESKRQPLSILRSWIAQLVIQPDGAHELAKTAYSKRQSPKATEQDLWHLFTEINTQVRNSVFVVDGYDECTTEASNLKTHASSTSRVAFLKKLISSTKASGSQLLLVSREDHDIREQLAGVGITSKTHEIFRLRVTQHDTRDDVASFSKSLMEQRLPNKTDELKRDLAMTAAEKCDGMFLWVRLLHERLSPGKNARQLLKMVVDTPAGLNQAYERELQAINYLSQDERDRATKILWWTLYAIRPLCVQELTEALLIELDDEQVWYPFEELPDAYDDFYIADQLRRLCGSLIDVRPREGSSGVAQYTVQFVHFSVKEYLSEALQQFLPYKVPMSDAASIHDVLAQYCLQYLCYNDFIQESVSTKEEFDQKVQKYNFLRYSSRVWIAHASRANPPSSDLVELSNKLHDRPGYRWRSYSEVLLNARRLKDFSKCLVEYRGSWPEPLYLASVTGITETVRYVIGKTANLDDQAGAERRTALFEAIYRRHFSTAMLLLDQGADVNISTADGYTCLHKAASTGQLDIMRALIGKGASIDAQDMDGYTSLIDVIQKASPGTGVLQNQVDVVRILIDRGAKVDVQDKSGETALFKASRLDHTEIVTILVDNGADPNIATRAGQNSLLIAAVSGHPNVVEILLRKGAKVNAQDRSGCTALYKAAVTSHIGIIRILIDHDANPNIAAKSGLGDTPLHVCCENGNEELAGLFLDHRCNLNATDYVGSTPLIRMIRRGRRSSALLSKLLVAGAKVNQQDFRGQTALHHIVQSIITDILKRIARKKSMETSQMIEDAITAPVQLFIQTLLRNGADPSQRDQYGWSSADWASRYPTILRLLLPPGTIYHPLHETEVTYIRRHSLKPAINHLVRLENLDVPDTLRFWFSHVGRLLLASGHREDARTALMASMVARESRAQPKYTPICDICAATVVGDRYICETCAETVLCGDCLKLYMMEPMAQPARLSIMLGSCTGHDFFYISEEEYRKLPQGMVNGRGETSTAFVKRLGETFA